MVTMLDALARSADRIFSSLDRPAEGGALSQYVASLGGGSEEQVALEKSLRLLHMFVRFGDALGTVQACDALVQLIRTGGATRLAARSACGTSSYCVGGTLASCSCCRM